jgi:type VI protein secretion system component VasK
MFRLLEKAQISSNQGDTFVASWSMLDSNRQRLNVSFKIRPDRSASLFQAGMLQGYRLPAEVFLHTSAGDKRID